MSCLYKHLIFTKTLGHTSLVVKVGHSLTTWGISLAWTVYTTKGHLSPQDLLCIGGVPEKYTQSSRLPPGLALSLAAERGLLERCPCLAKPLTLTSALGLEATQQQSQGYGSYSTRLVTSIALSSHSAGATCAVTTRSHANTQAPGRPSGGPQHLPGFRWGCLFRGAHPCCLPLHR